MNQYFAGRVGFPSSQVTQFGFSPSFSIKQKLIPLLCTSGHILLPGTDKNAELITCLSALGGTPNLLIPTVQIFIKQELLAIYWRGDWGVQSATQVPWVEGGKTKRDLVLLLRHRLLSYHKSQQLKRFQSGSTVPWERVRLPVLPWETDTRQGSRMKMSYPGCWAHSHYQMLKCFTYLPLCRFLLPFPRTRARAAALSCGVRWTLPWKPGMQRTPPTRVARRWVAEVVFYFFEHPSSRTLNLEFVKHH